MSTPWIIAFICLWVLVALLGTLTLGVLRRLAPVLERLETTTAPVEVGVDLMGLPPGQTPAAFTVFDQDGASIDSATLLRHPSVILFLESGCGPCRAVADEIAGLDVVAEIPLQVVLDDTSLGREFFPRDARVPQFFQPGRQASAAFRSNASPQAFLLGSDGPVVASSLIGSLADLAELAKKGGSGRTSSSRASDGVATPK